MAAPLLLTEIVPSQLKPPLNTTLITSAYQLPALDKYLDTAAVVGFDAETNMTKVHTDRYVRTVQIGDKEQQFVVDLLALAGNDTSVLVEQQKTIDKSPLHEVLGRHLGNRKLLKVGHGIRFDYEVVAHRLGIHMDNMYCTLIAEQLLNCGKMNFMAKHFWGLEDLLARYCRRSLDKGLQTSFDLSTPLTDRQVEYCALDVRLPLPIRELQLKQLEKHGMSFIAQVEMDAIWAFGDMHINGMYLNQASWLEKVENVRKQHIKNIEALDKHFIPVVGTKTRVLPDPEPLRLEWLAEERDKEKRAELREKFYDARRAVAAHAEAVPACEGEALINYGSPKQLLAALKALGLKLTATDDRALEKVAAKHPVAKALQEYRSTGKILTTYGPNFVEHVNPDTGRTHPTVNQIGAETGRTSAVKFNSQNLPELFRSSFEAQKENHILNTTDMAGAELRILAELSGEESWITAFQNDWDLHSMCGSELTPEEWSSIALPDCEFANSKKKCKCPAHKALRNSLKSLNFGIPYGMEAGKLSEKLGISREEALKLLDKHRARYRKVHAWLKGAADSGKMTLQSRTLGGRLRWFTAPTWEKAKEKALADYEKDKKNPNSLTSAVISKRYYSMWSSIERESKNTPIQGGNADIAKHAMGLMRQGLYAIGWKLINFVHDEFVTEGPKESAQQAQLVVGEAIKLASKSMMKFVTMDYEGNIHKQWVK